MSAEAQEPHWTIEEYGGRVFLLDASTGRVWVLVAANSVAPRWQEVEKQQPRQGKK